MRNPRRIILDEQTALKLKLNPAPPPPGSLFWRMRDHSKDIAKQALETEFIQGISAGNLSPDKYGAFNVSDAYYCFHGAPDYLKAANRVDNDHQLKAFLMKKYESYEQYNREFPKTYHVKDASGVVPTPICKEYSAYETSVAGNASLDPGYCIIVMLPCEYLWYWLADQLAPPKQGNLYAPWISGNLDPHGAYAMGNFINGYMERHPGKIDPDKAIDIYRTATEFEFKNFQTATN